jgi:hypothetical protein
MYFSHNRVKSYLTVLTSHKYIIESGLTKGHQLYCLSEIGLQVINELHSSYEIELSKFCNQYNITL